MVSKWNINIQACQNWFPKVKQIGKIRAVSQGNLFSIRTTRKRIIRGHNNPRKRRRAEQLRKFEGSNLGDYKWRNNFKRHHKFSVRTNPNTWRCRYRWMGLKFNCERVSGDGPQRRFTLSSLTYNETSLITLAHLIVNGRQKYKWYYLDVSEKRWLTNN